MFFKDYIIHKFMILLVLFYGLFSNTVAAGTSIAAINHLSKIALTTSFTSNPPAVSGTISICQGQSITYTDTSTGVGTNPIYAWSFGGGNITSFASASPPAIIYNTSGTFSTTLTVNGIISSVTVFVNSGTPSNPIITVTPNVGWAVTNFNSTNYFNYCADGSNGGLFMFSTNSTNTNTNTQHAINWGDGSPITTSTIANITDEFHAYTTNGIFQITYTVILQSGCSYTKTYNVFIGANPTASIINNGVLVLCNPGSVQYSIIPGAQNTFGTIYTFQVNDTNPSQTQTFTHAQVITPGFSVTHNFATVSCNTSSNINGTVYPNSFQASITVSNPCGSSSSAIGPINIQSKPNANISANPANSQICLNTSVVFTDTTTPGTNIGSSPTFTCTQTYQRYWQITGPSGLFIVPATGILAANTFISVIGNLGFNVNLPNNPSIWTGTATNTLTITFNTQGTYSITLFTSGSNNCGITSQTKTICVNPEVIADFTMNPTTGCSPTTVTLDNLSSLPGCTNTNVYAWQVTPSNPLNCPNVTSPGWSFTSGNASSFEPEITFTSAGIYTVQLTTSLQNAIAGLLCQPDIKTQTITIKDKPRTTLSPQIICEGTTITLNPTVFNCYATQAVTYSWDFLSNPAVTISDTTASNPTIIFTSPGTYNYTLTLTNECGSIPFSSFIQVDPAVQITASGPTATCLNTGIPLIGSITGGATIGTWTASITGGVFSPSTAALSPTYTPPTNYTGTITFTLTSAAPAGPCPPKTISFQIVINAQATVEAGTYNPVCLNGSVQLNGIVGGAASSGSWTSSNGGTFSNANSLTSTYSPPTGFIGTIVLTLTTNDPPGPCNSVTDTVIITVIPTPTINSISNAVVCHNGSVGPISFSGTSATNFSWTNSNPLIGIVATGTTTISFVGTNTGATPITGTITVTSFNTSGATSCPSTPTTFTITINPRGQVNTIPGQVVCNGNLVTVANFSNTNTGGTTTYAWTSTNAAVGLATSGNGDIPTFTAANITSAPINTTITVTPTFENGGVSCSGTPKTITITVNPTGQVNQPNNEVFCAGTATTSTIPFSTTNTGGTTIFNCTIDNNTIGLPASGSGSIPIFTPINNGTSPITSPITVTPLFSNGGAACLGTSKMFTITINPKGQVNTISNQIICNGDSTAAVALSTTIIGITSYSWTNSNSSIGIGLTGIGDIPTFVGANSSNSPAVGNFVVTPIFSNASVSCPGPTQTFSITVNPVPQVNTISNQVVCHLVSTSAINFTTTNTGSGTVSYNWENDTPSIGLAGSGSGNIAAFSALNSGTAPVIATITVTPSYVNGVVTCLGTPKIVTITVNPKGQVNTISNQTVCNGLQTNAINFSTTNTGGNTTYSWVNNLSSIGLLGSGSGNIAAFNALNSTALTVIATITVTPTFANGSSTCIGAQQQFTITVNPSPAVTFTPTNQSICSGDSSVLVTLGSATAGATYSWTAVQPADIIGVTTSGTTTIPVQTLTNASSAPITITYNATATIAGGATCAGAVYTYTITVKPRPAITEAFTSNTCSGSGFTVTPLSSALNSIPTGNSYSWPAPSVIGGLTGGASGVGQLSITGTLFNPTNTSQTAIYSVTPIVNGCIGTAFTVTVTVNPKPVIAGVTPAAICSGTSFSVTPNNSGTTIVPSGTTYIWTVGVNPNITGQSASTATGITMISQTLINGVNTSQSLIYTVTPTSGSTGNCVGTPFTITVTVNPKPTITDVTPAAICSGTTFSVTPSNSGATIVPTGTTYTWTAPVSIPLGAITGGIAQPIGQNSISQLLNNTTNSTGTLDYTVTPTSGSCQGTPFHIIVTVNPIPGTLSLTNLSYCNGVLTAPIVFSNAVSGTTYAWTNSNPLIGLTPTSGVGNIPAFTATNGGATAITSTISVIASANGCSRAAETFTITVNPSPAVTFTPTNQSICSGDSSVLVTLGSATAGATYSWTAVQPADIIGVTTSGTTTIPVQTLTNASSAPITITYNATATIAGGATCAGASYAYTITVKPRPAIQNQSIVICNNQSFTINPINGTPTSSSIVPVGTIYTWTIVQNPNITGATAGTGTSINQTLTNSSNSVQLIDYNVIPTYLNCPGNPFSVRLTVNPTPTVQFSGFNQVICNNSQSLPVTLSTNATGIINYSWTSNNPAGITGIISSGTNSIPSQTLINNTNNPITINYTAFAVIAGSLNCQGPSSIYTIIVNPTILTSSVLTNYNSYNVSFFGGSNGAIDLTVTGGSGVYTYNWTGPNSFVSSFQDISNLVAGNYSVRINDGYCNPVILNFTLTQPPELLIQENLQAHVNLLCFGDNNGKIGVTITQGSVAPYTYQLLNSSGLLINTIPSTNLLNVVFNGLIAGTYSIKVTDSNNGVKTISGIVVTQPNDIIITAITTPITCYGGNNASITLTVTGGTSPYTGSWNNLATGLYQNNLSAGTYTVLVKDTNNCPKPITVIIPEAPIFTVNPVVTNVSCFGANDGSINLNFIGGISPIVLTWSDGSIAGTTRNNLGPGTYSVTIRDSKPCYINKTFIIVEPQLLVLASNITNALDCNNANSGSINLMVSGGNPPFTYSWSNGATTEDLTNVVAGNYSVTVRDSKGCTKSALYVISRPPPIVLGVQTNTNFNCVTKIVKQTFVAQASGGVPPYSFNWSSGTVSGVNNQIMNTSINGMILLQATDAIGCSTNYTFNVDIPTLGNISFNSNSYAFATYGSYSINDPIQFTNIATGNFISVNWSFGDGTYSTDLNPIHQYVSSGTYIITQTVTYPFGCVYDNVTSIIIGEGYALVVPNAFTPNNDALNAYFQPKYKGLTDFVLDVYDTWGELIYSENGDAIRGWDGKAKGVDSENGNYYYKVSGKTFYGKIIEQQASFVLIK